MDEPYWENVYRDITERKILSWVGIALCLGLIGVFIFDWKKTR